MHHSFMNNDSLSVLLQGLLVHVQALMNNNSLSVLLLGLMARIQAHQNVDEHQNLLELY